MCEFGVLFEGNDYRLAVVESVELGHLFSVQVYIDAFDGAELFLEDVKNGKVLLIEHFLKDRAHGPGRFGEAETARDRVFNEEVEDSFFYEFDVVDL